MTRKRLAPDDEILVSVLARRDSFWIPQRRFLPPSCPANANVYLLRRDYVAGRGFVPWASGAASGRDRLRSHRSLDGLVGAGLIEAHKDGGRTTGVRLSDAGELRAQYLAAMPTLTDAWPWALFDAIKRRDGFSVHEDHLIPAWRAALKPIGEWSRVDCLANISDCLLPFLCRRWIHGGATLEQNARYAPGEEVANAVRPEPVNLPDVSDKEAAAGREVYISVFNDCYAALAKDEPAESGEIGPVPFCSSAASDIELAAWKRSAEMAAKGL
jgi:hypothetical protein